MALVKLGLWQTDRALEKETRLQNIAQLSQTNAMSLSKIQSYPANQINDFPIKLEGQFDEKALFLLDNQTNNGQLGYRVYQVFDVDQQSVLVNLGWVLGSINRDEIPNVQPITGQFVIHGHIRLIEKGILLMEQKFSHVNWPLRIQQIEINKLATIVKKPLLPFVVYVNEDESLGYKKNWQPIVMPPEKHRAYAFQWFSLAIVWIILMLWASIKFAKTGPSKHHQNKANNKSKN